MLKFIYTETALYLELITADIEEWVEHRLLFASSIGETMFVSGEKATFLLPDLICETTTLNFYLHAQGVKTVTVSRCDLDRIEIGLAGYWISTQSDGAEGIFVTQLPDRVEFHLWQLWCKANSQSVTS
jgi:hypothetical protein